MSIWMTRRWLAVRHHLDGRLDDHLNDRGDVPGWVMVTLMTAGLVILLWGLAGPRLAAMFEQSMDTVLRGPN